MNDRPTTTIATLSAPFGQQIELQNVEMADDVRLMRVRIRERSRFTVFDIDPATAHSWGRALCDWAAATGTLIPDSANDD